MINNCSSLLFLSGISKRNTFNVKNIRSHALNATKKRQNVNLQVYRLDDGSKVRLSVKEIRDLNKQKKSA